MQKLIFILLPLLISLPSIAQIKTGGGSNSADIDATISDLIDRLKINDLTCPSKGPRLGKDKDLIQIYLKLSMLKNTEPKSEDCGEEIHYLNCVNDKIVRKIARKLRRQSKDSDHFANTYKIPQSEVDKLIFFFSTLGETIGEEDAYDGEDL